MSCLQIRIYAGNELTGIVQDSGNTHFVGFSLPSTSVSPEDVISGSDFSFYVYYVLSTTTLIYITCTTTIWFLVTKTNKKRKKSKSHNPTKSFTNMHPEVLIGATIVMGAFSALEVIAEFVMAIIWTINVNDHDIAYTVFAAALTHLLPGILSACQIGRDLYRTYRHHTYTSIEENGSTLDSNRQRTKNKNHAIFVCFIWVMAYFASIVLYCFFPAFVLAFAYPTRVITVFTFVATFMILSVVCLTTYIQNGAPHISNNKWKNAAWKFFIWCTLTLLQVYFFLFIFAVLYSLVIGRASVISSAPLAVLSLLPSILISIAAWIMKSTFLPNEDTAGNDKDAKMSATGLNSIIEECPTERGQEDGEQGGTGDRNK